MPTGSSFSAAFIRWRCIFPSDCWFLFRCLKWPAHSRPALREAAGFVLALAFASCLVALTLGFLLAYGSGDCRHRA